jgi:hypothetical protein
MINAEVVKNNNENNLNLIRRFTKKVQGYVKKKKTLKVLKRRAEVDELIKMGKMTEFTRGGKK